MLKYIYFGIRVPEFKFDSAHLVCWESYLTSLYLIYCWCDEIANNSKDYSEY